MPTGGSISPVLIKDHQECTVRPATAADISRIRQIYAIHVGQGTGTFEETAPGVTEMEGRRRSLVELGFPYLVACRGDTVQAFAYASYFHQRTAYRFTVEDTVYVHPDAMGQGLGRLLLGRLIEDCSALGHRQMITVIGDSGNVRSIRLHARMGFQRVGFLSRAGFKFGRWLDVVFMQRSLGGS